MRLPRDETASDGLVALASFTQRLQDELDEVISEIDCSNVVQREEAVVSDDDADDDEMRVVHSTPHLLREINDALKAHSTPFADRMHHEPITPFADAVTDVRSPGGTTTYDVSSSTKFASIAELVSVDYSRWTGRCRSNETSMAEVLTRYYGVKPIDAKYKKEQLNSISIVHVLEVVLRPDTPVQFVMAGVEKVASILGINFEKSKSMEPCEDQDLECCSHAVLRITEPCYVNGLGSDKGNVKWTELDVQICLSTSIMKRVLLCQFVDNSDTMEKEVRKCSSLNNFMIPSVFQVEKCFRQIFTKYLLSLSCLHALRGSAFNVSFDATYLSQIESYFRKEMWNKVHRGAEEVQVQLVNEEEKFNMMRSILTPIYKQHGLPPLTDLTVLTTLKKRSRQRRYPPCNSKSFTSIAVDIEMEKKSDDNCDTKSTSSNELCSVHHMESLEEDEGDYEYEGGAMEKCLKEESVITSRIRDKCDEEFADRMNCRNEGTVEAFQSIVDRRTALLLYILNNPISFVSSLTRSFVTAFDGVIPISISNSASSTSSASHNDMSYSLRCPPSSREKDKKSTNGTSSWISRWMVKDHSPTPDAQTGSSNADSLGISRWIGRERSTPSPSADRFKSKFPLVSSEVVLFYCSCWQSYSMQRDSTGAGGFLYLTEHYIGLVCRTVVGLNKRKELFLLNHLRDVTPWSGGYVDDNSDRTVIDEENEIEVVRRKKKQSPSKSGGFLSSLASATGLSHLTSGCKLSFEITQDISNNHIKDSEYRYDSFQAGDESLSVDVYIIPGIPVAKLELLLMEAKRSLHS